MSIVEWSSFFLSNLPSRDSLFFNECCPFISAFLVVLWFKCKWPELHHGIFNLRLLNVSDRSIYLVRLGLAIASYSTLRLPAAASDPPERLNVSHDVSR